MSLRTVEYCVFDEADRLFEMGFAAQLKEILNKMNESRQALLCDAPCLCLAHPSLLCLFTSCMLTRYILHTETVCTHLSGLIDIARRLWFALAYLAKVMLVCL